ncbi:hypothetical protein BSKO_03785 [Bryopsis sp. KO-2023]|nr:hypothetical protein BSKO_03785 [Bryopsis sp. KO-2023]
MCPKDPKARTSTAVNPAGSPVLRPKGLSTKFNPEVANLLTVGAKPKRPAARHNPVLATMMRLGVDPMKSAETFTERLERATGAWTTREDGILVWAFRPVKVAILDAVMVWDAILVVQVEDGEDEARAPVCEKDGNTIAMRIRQASPVLTLHKILKKRPSRRSRRSEQIGCLTWRIVKSA